MATLTIILAIGKFNDQPMYKFAKFIVSFMFSPKLRIWHKQGGEVTLVKPAAPKASAEKKTVRKEVSHTDFAQLATVLDSRGRNGMNPKILVNPEK